MFKVTSVQDRQVTFCTFYTIHTALASYHSPFLADLIKTSPQNAPYIEIFVPDPESRLAFGAIQSWIYTQSTNGWKETWGLDSEWLIYLVWVQAEHYQMPLLQNAAMRLMAQMPLPMHMLKYVYNNTDTDSQLRAWMVRRLVFVAVNGDEALLATAVGKEQYPAALLVDFVDTWKELQNWCEEERKKCPKPEDFFVDVY
jgi:hypothetical protein